MKTEEILNITKLRFFQSRKNKKDVFVGIPNFPEILGFNGDASNNCTFGLNQSIYLAQGYKCIHTSDAFPIWMDNEIQIKLPNIPKK